MDKTMRRSAARASGAESPNVGTNPKIETEEVLFILGLAALFAGLWLWFGPAQALTVCGGVVLLFVAFLLWPTGAAR